MTPWTNKAKGLECKQVLCCSSCSAFLCKPGTAVVLKVVAAAHVILFNFVCLTGRSWCERAARRKGKLMILIFILLSTSIHISYHHPSYFNLLYWFDWFHDHLAGWSGPSRVSRPARLRGAAWSQGSCWPSWAPRSPRERLHHGLWGTVSFISSWPVNLQCSSCHRWQSAISLT